MKTVQVVYSAFKQGTDIKVRKTNINPVKIRDIRKLKNKCLIVASSYNFAIVLAHMNLN